MAKIYEFKPKETPKPEEKTNEQLEEEMFDALMAGVPEGHCFGHLFCMSCKHEWDGITPPETDYFECPECHRHMGRHKYSFRLQKSPIWQCQCENTLFEVTDSGIFCPNCGMYQVFPY